MRYQEPARAMISAMQPSVELVSANGFRFKIDVADEPLVASRRWYALARKRARYIVSTGDAGCRLHRLIAAAVDGQVVDHINGDTLDNRRANLRICSHAQNCWNAGRHSDSTSPYKGVTFNRRRGKWIARISKHGERVHLGAFDSAEDARDAFAAAAAEMHGAFARTGDTAPAAERTEFDRLELAREIQSTMFSHNTSGIRGVAFDRRRNRWRVTIKIGGRHQHLGYFVERDDAIRARAKADDAAAIAAAHKSGQR